MCSRGEKEREKEREREHAGHFGQCKFKNVK